jgi:hypothetical protein
MARMQLSPDQRASDQGLPPAAAGFAVHLTIADQGLGRWPPRLAFLLLDMLLDIVEGPLAPNKFVLVRKLCWSLGVDERELAALGDARCLAARDGAAFGHGYGRRYGHAGSTNDQYEQASNKAPPTDRIPTPSSASGATRRRDQAPTAS